MSLKLKTPLISPKIDEEIKVSSSWAQRGEAAKPSTYLRVANLLPLKSAPVSLVHGESTIWRDMQPGYQMPYLPVEEEGSYRVVQGETSIGNFILKKGKKDVFYTVVIVSDQGSSPKIVFNCDNEPMEATAPPRRFRGYFGGFSFPYRVDAGEVGSWAVTGGNALCVDVPFSENAPASLSLTYKSRDGNMVTVHFPLDYANHAMNSAFVSQRGLSRPRLSSAPDNLPPREDFSAPPMPAPTPTPTPTPVPEP